jgi:hypothetical protein
MSRGRETRRDFLQAAGSSAAVAAWLQAPAGSAQSAAETLDPLFLITESELDLKFEYSGATRNLSFHNFKGTRQAWLEQCRSKLRELMALSDPSPGPVRELRKKIHQGVTIRALVMQVTPGLSIPAYLLEPPPGVTRRRALMAIHGHGEVEPVIGLRDDYHHAFGLEMAKLGHLVLCPEHRGFGTLRNACLQKEGCWLEYWHTARGRQFTFVTEGFLYGKTMIGQNVDDLLRWENWLGQSMGVTEIDAAGISYGGDLALAYPVFSNRVKKIFASGTLGSFAAIYSRSYNAPAHCIPGVLRWMDRSDIAGLNAPRPIVVHYGELDTPSPKNSAASYNESVHPAMTELKAIYRAFGAQDVLRLVVTPRTGHRMDLEALKSFLST